MNINEKLKKELFLKAEEKHCIPYGVDEKTSPFKFVDEKIILRTFIQDDECYFVDDDVIGFEFSSRETLPPYADDNLEFGIDLDDMCSAFDCYVRDNSLFREDLVSALMKKSTPEFYLELKTISQRYPSVTSSNNDDYQYSPEDFLTMFCQPNLFENKRAVYDRALPYILNEYEQYDMESDNPLVNEDFFDDAFALIQKYQLTDGDEILISSNNMGHISILDYEDIKKDYTYQSIKLLDNNHPVLERACQIAHLTEHEREVIEIEFIHTENANQYANQTVVAFGWADAFDFLDNLYEASQPFITYFDKTRAIGVKNRLLAEWCR